MTTTTSSGQHDDMVHQMLTLLPVGISIRPREAPSSHFVLLLVRRWW